MRLGGRRRSDPTGVGERLRVLARSGDLDRVPLTDVAAMLREQLEQQSLPAWCRTTEDRVHGGFLLAERRGVSRRNGGDLGKQLVSQSRMLWVLSHARVQGMDVEGHDVLARSSDGYAFLQRHFRDATHGGYVWTTTRSGVVRSDLKILYGQAFVIFALVEYSRASGDRAPLREALELFRLVMERLHDLEHDGWVEHARADWRALGPLPNAPVGPSGTKSANTLLHWMEALTELAAETGDAQVHSALERTVGLLVDHCFPDDPRTVHARFSDRWDRIDDVDGDRFSLGHSVEFAWLLVRAERVLGRPPSLGRLDNYIDHALGDGFDPVRGGLGARATVGEARGPRRRTWWVQAELLAALSVAVAQPGGERHEPALRRQLAFVLAHQVDPRDGVWWEEVDENGRIIVPRKRHHWKAAYHEVRAMVMLSDAMRDVDDESVSR